MPDREKVIKAIDICLGHGHCDDCGYRIKGGYSIMDCRKPMMRDALELLKEQEEQDEQEGIIEYKPVKKEWRYGATLKEAKAVNPIRDKKTGRFWLCGNCGAFVGYEDNDPSDPNEFDNYCRNCGQEVKWDENTRTENTARVF